MGKHWETGVPLWIKGDLSQKLVLKARNVFSFVIPTGESPAMAGRAERKDLWRCLDSLRSLDMTHSCLPDAKELKAGLREREELCEMPRLRPVTMGIRLA